MKIRPKFIGEEGRYSDSYPAHIAKYEGLSCSNVYKAFGGNFFHDGLVSKIHFLASGQIHLDISSPNFYVEEDELFLSVDFKVRFLGVDYFSVNNSAENLDVDGDLSSFEVLHAEFNSLGITEEDLLKKFTDSPFSDNSGMCELVLECLLLDSLYIGIRFSKFEIEPVSEELFYFVAKASGANYRMFSC